MKINMDEEIQSYQLRKSERTELSGMKWFFIIALGVFIGNSASFALEKAVFYWELKQAAAIATAVMEDSNKRKAQQRKLSAAQAKQRELKTEQKQAGLRQATETCNFWRQQLASNNTSANRMNKNQACSLVSQFR